MAAWITIPRNIRWKWYTSELASSHNFSAKHTKKREAAKIISPYILFQRIYCKWKTFEHIKQHQHPYFIIASTRLAASGESEWRKARWKMDKQLTKAFAHKLHLLGLNLSWNYFFPSTFFVSYSLVIFLSFFERTQDDEFDVVEEQEISTHDSFRFMPTKSVHCFYLSLESISKWCQHIFSAIVWSLPYDSLHRIRRWLVRVGCFYRKLFQENWSGKYLISFNSFAGQTFNLFVSHICLFIYFICECGRLTRAILIENGENRNRWTNNVRKKRRTISLKWENKRMKT